MKLDDLHISYNNNNNNNTIITNNNNILITHNDLISLGFVHTPTLLINDYSLAVSHFDSEYKTISVSLNPGNVYVYLRSGAISDDRRNDSIITVFNADIQGVLTKDWIESFIKLIK